MPKTGADPRGQGGRLGSGILALLELLALCGLALAQPALDAVGRSPDFLLFHRLNPGEVLLLVAVLALLPPLALWAVEAAAGLAGPRARRATHALLVAGLMVVLAVQVGKHLTGLRGPVLAAAASAAGLLATAVCLRSRLARQVLRAASPAPVVFAALFLLASPASALVVPWRGASPEVAATRTRAEHPPIVFVLLDEFPLASLLSPGGRIDAEAFPNFAWLAGHTTWYRNATGVSGWTPFALPAMLTGRYPARVAAPHWRAYPQNLFTLLQGTYRLRVEETISLLRPPERRGAPGSQLQVRKTASSLQLLWPAMRDLAGFLIATASPTDPQHDITETYADTAPPPRVGAAGQQPSMPIRGDWSALDDDQPARFRAFLQGLTPSPTPTLHFLHLLLPHTPWRYLPNGMRYPSDLQRSVPRDPSPEEPWWGTFQQQRQVLQIAYTDRLLGDLLRTLRERGLLDDALLVVTADHGRGFEPGTRPRKLGTGKNAASLLWVPLFIKAPGQREGRVDDRNWEHVDLLPTIADHAGLRVPWRVDGISALSGQARQRTQKWFYDTPGKRLVVDGPSHFARVLRGVADWRAAPGDPPGAALFRYGPRPELIGRPLSSFQLRSGGPAAAVKDLVAFADVRPERGQVPAFVQALLPPGSVPPGTLVAVALNGEVGAVVPAVRVNDEEHLRVMAMLPYWRFRPGPNQLSLYLVEQGGSTLRRLPLYNDG